MKASGLDKKFNSCSDRGLTSVERRDWREINATDDS